LHTIQAPDAIICLTWECAVAIIFL
jgi:hypothetical protein